MIIIMKETKDTFVALQQQQHHHPIINNLVRIATSSIAVLECSLCEIDTHFPVLCSLYTSTFFIFIALCCALTRRSGGALNYIITGGLVLEEATRNLIDYKFYLVHSKSIKYTCARRTTLIPIYLIYTHNTIQILFLAIALLSAE